VLRNDQIQSAWVDYLKANTTILAELSDNDEIREDNWQGDEFSYPNIRVRIVSNTPMEGRDCNLHDVVIGTLAFSEQASSQQADRIAGIIMTELHDKQFVSENIAFGVRTSDLIPAVRTDERTWRSEAIMSIRVSG
jgi:hypothetical protein